MPKKVTSPSPGRLPETVEAEISSLTEAVEQVIQQQGTGFEKLHGALDGLLRAVADVAEVEDHPGWGTKTDLPTIVAENLRALRDEAGWTQAQLAESMTQMGFEWKRITVAEVENTTRRISIEELCALASLFAVSMFSLLLPSGPSDIELNDTRYLDAKTLRELMLGPGGELGAGGPTWLAAARAAGTPRGSADVRPTVDLWRNRARQENNTPRKRRG